jgi:hypothetical protein
LADEKPVKLALLAGGQFRISGKFRASHSQYFGGSIPPFVYSVPQNKLFDLNKQQK